MKKLLLLLAFFSFQFVNAQTNDSVIILLDPEIMPEFVGGEQAMYEYISAKLIYPASARKKNIEAKVLVRFAIMQNGKADYIEILSKTPQIFNAEVIRVIKSMPKWKPGMQDGRPVPVYLTLPFEFKLE